MISIAPFGVFGTSLHAGMATLQLVLLAIAFKLERREAWLACLGGVALAAFIAWVAALRRRRAIAGTPTSRIASAAQGYVELQGVGRPLDVNPLHSPVSGDTCLWYHYRVERKSGDDRWEVIEQARSHTSFVLDDGSGHCLVDPEGAEILTRHCKRWDDGNYRYAEWTLQQRDRVYVLGNFVTRHASQGLDPAAHVRDLLAEWKQDQMGLLRRFDLDHDGRIDQREWALARRLARGEIEKRHRELRQQADLHLVQGAASRLYLISNYEPEKLARRFLWLAVLQLGGFFTALGFLGWWWQRA